jgi:hypothetical protein
MLLQISSVMEMEACPSSYRTNIALERQQGADVPEAVEGDPRQHRPLLERREGLMARGKRGGQARWRRVPATVSITR